MNSMMLDSDEEQASDQGIVNKLEKELNSLGKIRVSGEHQFTQSDN